MQTEREKRDERIKRALNLVEGLRKGACPCGYMGTIVSGKCFKCGTDWRIGPTPPDSGRPQDGDDRAKWAEFYHGGNTK